MKIIIYILIGVFTLSLSSLNGDDWSLEINPINFDSSVPGDMIVMGVCEDCHDGFH